MVQLFVQSRDRSALSATPGEDIRTGELIYVKNGTAYRATDSDGVEGIAMGVGSAPWIAEHDEDYRQADPNDPLAPFVYSPSQKLPMPYYDLREDGQRMRVRTVDHSSTLAAPNIQGGDVVGVIDKHEGRVVQEGYSSGGTTYDRATGNFTPIGQARGNAAEMPVTEKGELVSIFNDDF